MTGILLTQDTGKILGPVAKVLGIIMNGIFNFLDMIGIPNIGLAIILFTIVIYLLLMPLTIRNTTNATIRKSSTVVKKEP